MHLFPVENLRSNHSHLPKPDQESSNPPNSGALRVFDPDGLSDARFPSKPEMPSLARLFDSGRVIARVFHNMGTAACTRRAEILLKLRYDCSQIVKMMRKKGQLICITRLNSLLRTFDPI